MTTNWRGSILIAIATPQHNKEFHQSCQTYFDKLLEIKQPDRYGTYVSNHMTIVKFSTVFHTHGRELGHDEPYMDFTTLQSISMDAISDAAKLFAEDYETKIPWYIIELYSVTTIASLYIRTFVSSRRSALSPKPTQTPDDNSTSTNSPLSSTRQVSTRHKRSRQPLNLFEGSTGSRPRKKRKTGQIATSKVSVLERAKGDRSIAKGKTRRLN